MKKHPLISRRLVPALSLCCGLVHSAYAYYNPSTGRWLSRDPVAERGGKNIYAFVCNAALHRLDRLGLAPGPASYQYSEGPPTGVWVVRLAQVETPGAELHGFRSDYFPSTDPRCPCKKENIVLVQAVYNLIDGYRMDNPPAYTAYRHQKGTPVPDYWLFAKAWLLAQRANPLEIVDAPILAQTEHNDFTWELEDCAICRHKLASGTTVDRVLGCLKFDFVRHADGTADLDSGAYAIFAAAKSPGKLWRKALQNWRDWTDN
jgi:hypothetical protein